MRDRNGIHRRASLGPSTAANRDETKYNGVIGIESVSVPAKLRYLPDRFEPDNSLIIDAAKRIIGPAIWSFTRVIIHHIEQDEDPIFDAAPLTEIRNSSRAPVHVWKSHSDSSGKEIYVEYPQRFLSGS